MLKEKLDDYTVVNREVAHIAKITLKTDHGLKHDNTEGREVSEEVV